MRNNIASFEKTSHNRVKIMEKINAEFIFAFNFAQNITLLRVRVFYSLTLRLFEKAQRVKDILVPPKCLLLFQKK